jgi:predicted aspartyl protease
MSSLLLRSMLAGMFLSAAAISAADLEEIMDKHIEAIGGREAIIGVHSMTSFTSVDYSGLSGRQTVRLKFPFKLHLMADFGVMTQELGYDGVSGWIIDPNRMVRRTSLEETKDIINDIYLYSFSYAVNGGWPGEIMYCHDTTIADTIYHNLLLLPQGGDSVSIYINSETGLPGYRLDVISGLRIITRLYDYRPVHGMMVAHASEAVSPYAPLQISTRLDSMRINNDIPYSIFEMPGRAAKDYEFPDNVDSIVLPIENQFGYLFIGVVINGKGPFMFFIDTGAGMTILSRSTADSLGLEIVGDIPIRGFGGFGSVGFIEIDSSRVNDLSLDFSRLIVFDFSSFESEFRNQVDGILGYDFFARFTVKIDFQNNEFVIYKPDAAPEQFSGEPVGLEIFAQVPVFQARINGHPIRLLLDLGAQPGLVIAPQFAGFNELAKREDRNHGDMVISGVGGVKKLAMAGVDSLNIGSIILRGLKAVIVEDFSDLPFPEYVEGIIGLEILSRFDLVLDCPSGKVYFDEK